MLFNSITEGYVLEFSNGHGWQIIVGQGTNRWVDKVAAILGLKPGRRKGLPKIVFIMKEKSRHPRSEGEWMLDDRKYYRLWIEKNSFDIVYELGNIPEHMDINVIASLLNSLVPIIYEKLFNTGCMPLHAALIEKDGRGFLIAARGGTGKSTCCQRIPSPWKALGDDETFVVVDKKGEYSAHPFPTWSVCISNQLNCFWNVQSGVKIAAVLFLERSEKDSVLPMGRGQAAWRIYSSAMEAFEKLWNRPKKVLRLYKRQILSISFQIAGKVPAYVLRASLSGRFWEEVEKLDNSFVRL